MFKRRMNRLCLVLIICGFFTLSCNQAQAAPLGVQPDRFTTRVKAGETRKVRFYTFGRSIYGKDVTYVDMLVSNVYRPAPRAAAHMFPTQWGNFACSGSYTAYNALSQVIYKWSTTQSYSVSPTLETVYLFDYITDYKVGGGWSYRSKAYTHSLSGTSQAYAFSQGNFEYPFVARNGIILSFTINFMRECSISWYESAW